MCKCFTYNSTDGVRLSQCTIDGIDCLFVKTLGVLFVLNACYRRFYDNMNITSEERERRLKFTVCFLNLVRIRQHLKHRCEIRYQNPLGNVNVWHSLTRIIRIVIKCTCRAYVE